MIRTSLTLPPDLHQRLLLTSRQENKTFSEVIRELLLQALHIGEQTHRPHMYNILKRLEGIGKPGIMDVSTTIDETLYGEHGAWRGDEIER